MDTLVSVDLVSPNGEDITLDKTDPYLACAAQATVTIRNVIR